MSKSLCSTGCQADSWKGLGGGGAANPALGKLGASCLVHFAKTSGVQFKGIMAKMDASVRETMEKAVRGEMSGYGGGQGVASSGTGGLKRLGKTVVNLKRFG